MVGGPGDSPFAFAAEPEKRRAARAQPVRLERAEVAVLSVLQPLHAVADFARRTQRKGLTAGSHVFSTVHRVHSDGLGQSDGRQRRAEASLRFQVRPGGKVQCSGAVSFWPKFISYFKLGPEQEAKIRQICTLNYQKLNGMVMRSSPLMTPAASLASASKSAPRSFLKRSLLAELQSLTEATTEEASGLFSVMNSFLTPQQVSTLAEFLLNDSDRCLAELEQVPARFAAQNQQETTSDSQSEPSHAKTSGNGETRESGETGESGESGETGEREVRYSELLALTKGSCSVEKLLSVLHSLWSV